MNELNKQQYDAVIYINGASLILAGAGSGKTRTLIYKIAYMNHKGISPENILAVTFTNKAANEMKERLLEIINKSNNDAINLKNTSDNLDEKVDLDDFIENDMGDGLGFNKYLEDYNNTSEQVQYNDEQYNKIFNWIGTFHSIFMKILKYDIIYLNETIGTNYNKNFNIANEGDSLSVLRKILKQLNVKDVFTVKEIKRTISKLKNEGLTSEDFAHIVQNENDEIVLKIYKIYEKELRKQNTLDFDDLLLLPYILLKKNKELLEKWKTKFKYILIDEAQDTNKIQFELIYMLSGSHGNITLIGDDFQSIYGWRGAIIEDFLNAKKYWPKLKIFKLEINYRSNENIVEAGNTIIENNKMQYKKNIKAFKDRKSKIQIIKFFTDEDEAAQVINLIDKFKKKGQKRSDFAIIYRTNAQSEPFEKILLSKNIPYKIYGGFKFYDRKEIKDILSYIKYLINPDDGISLARIINIPGRKIGKITIDKFTEQSLIKGNSLHNVIVNIDNLIIGESVKNNIREFNNLIKYIKEKIIEKNPSESIEIIINAIKYKKHIIKEFGETYLSERLSNIGQLINTASNFNQLGVEGLRKFIDEISLFVDLDEKMEDSPEQVKLMTVHGSKGLEFDTVFLVGLEENIFPGSRARFNKKELEEERRLAYVGITRAENNLFLTYAESRKQFGQLKYNNISRFIEEIPSHLTNSFNNKLGKKTVNIFEILNKVSHRIFGKGEVMEIFSEKVIVRFYLHGIKQTSGALLEKI